MTSDPAPLPRTSQDSPQNPLLAHRLLIPLATGDLDFFPMHRALSLRMETEREELEKRRNAELMGRLAERQKQLMDKSDVMSNEQLAAKTQMAAIADTLNGVQRELKSTRRSIEELQDSYKQTQEKLIENERLLCETQTRG